MNTASLEPAGSEIHTGQRDPERTKGTLQQCTVLPGSGPGMTP